MVVVRSGSVVHEKRRKMSRGMNLQVVNEDTKADKTTPTMAMATTHPPTFFRTMIRTLPTIPSIRFYSKSPKEAPTPK
jgi:hypothetical protein